MSAALWDSAARLKAVLDRGSVLVQAPAGSGKTTLLAQRYLRLLSAVDAPERILALTFTRRAAQEMRDRVLRALQAASLPACPPDVNPQTWDLAAGARRHLAALDIDIEGHPSRLRIETIDSFNAWLAAQLPITARTGGRLELVETARPLYEEAARRALAHEGTGAWGAAVDKVLALGDQRWRELIELIVEMLPTRDRWLRLLVGRLQAAGEIDAAQLARVRRHFDEDLELLIARTLQNAHDALGGEAIAALPPLLRAAAERLGAERAELAAWRGREAALQAVPADFDRWRGLAELLLTKAGKLRKRLRKGDGFPAECAETAPLNDLLCELDRRPAALHALGSVRSLPDARYSDDDWERVRSVAQVLVLAAAELEQVCRERGSVDFPAVSMAALRALGAADSPTDLGLRLDYRLQHLLLDEFQDTSSSQLELVGLLTAGWQRGDGRSVFCVGDPMQSIYGFRQAEVRAFLELADEGIGEVQFDVERLSSNFRSDRALVDWINARFESVMPRTDDRERGAIAFRPSHSGVAPAPAAEPGVGVRGFATRAAEALAVAELVQSRRSRHPDWRIAILVRARTHAREIAHALRTRGVAFRAIDIEPLQDRAAVRDLVMLVCALLHLGDRISWLAVLRAPWAGLRLADLLMVARAGPIVWRTLSDEAVLERLSPEGASRCRRLRAVLEDAFRVQSRTSVTRWAECTWLALGGPGCASEARELDETRAVFARLRELELRGLPDAADLQRSFADLFAHGGASHAVEIMTIHKAKGLEFDLVIVPALDRHARSAPGQLLLMHPFARAGRDGMVMAARPPVGAGADRLFDFLRRQARDAAGLEAQRLLYVACTRARWQLHLTATVGLREDPDDLDTDPEEAGDGADEPAASESAAAPAERPRPGNRAPGACSPCSGRACAASFPWPPVPVGRRPRRAQPVRQCCAVVRCRGFRRIGRRGRCARGRRARGSPALRPRASRRRCSTGRGQARRVGTLVHAELQAMRLEHTDEGTIRAREAHFERWLTLCGVPAERLREASERAMAALIAVHRDPRGRWILQQRCGDDLREHALSGLWRGEVLRAVFDRSFVESGVRWVIDYKTSEHAGGGLEEFLEREVERYRPQLERYAVLARKLGPEPVRVGLYFPLLGAWREWAPED